MMTIAGLCLPQVINAASWVSNTDSFLSMADLHFDPFVQCEADNRRPCPLIAALQAAPYEKWQSIFERDDSPVVSITGQDTNYALLKSTLIAVQSVVQNKHPDFILILGDFLGHNYRERYMAFSHDKTTAGYQQFVKKTFQFLTREIRQYIPNKDIYPVIGNNDSYHGDYHVVPNGMFLQDMTRIWARFFLNIANRKNFERDFPKGGYYAVALSNNSSQHLIFLNSVLFSAKQSASEKNHQAAKKELVWLHQQLMASAVQKHPVLLAFHIPVGVDVYATLKTLFGTIKEFWQPEYSALFLEDLKTFSSSIAAILSAHIHRDAFQFLVARQPTGVLVSFTASISPIFGNNPEFKIYHYDGATLRLKSVDIYFYPEGHQGAGEWQRIIDINPDATSFFQDK